MSTAEEIIAIKLGDTPGFRGLGAGFQSGAPFPVTARSAPSGGHSFSSGADEDGEYGDRYDDSYSKFLNFCLVLL